jgi:hypothetical protein
LLLENSPIEVLRLGIGLDAELAMNHLAMLSGAGQRARVVPGARERPHVPCCIAGTKGIELAQLVPPPDRVRWRAGFVRAFGESLDGTQCVGLQSGALFLDPAFELRGAGEIKGIEKLAGVETSHRLEVPHRVGGAQLPDIAIDGGIQAELSRPYDQIATGALPQTIESLREGVPGLLLPGFGPQDPDDSVSSNSARSRVRNDREQREWARPERERLPLDP